jgi:transposase
MEEVFVVRHRHLVEGVPVRRLAREMGISRNTIKRYLRGAEPGVGKPRGIKGRPVLDAVRPRAEEILGEAPRWTGGKQRLTAARLHELLRSEGFAVSRTVVKQIVREWKRRKQEVFVPLVYRAGDLAEVDFFEVLVDIAGERRKAHMFVMRLMHSGRDFAWLYPRQDQVCFLDGHVRAFAHLAAVPHRLAYDNLKAAVAKILVGSERELAARFLALTTHYLFEASFARPRTGHDKGGVEARGKGIRWQHLVPIPSGPDLATISTELLARLDACAPTSFSVEHAAMLPLPRVPFRSARCVHPCVSRRSLAKVDGAVYSVWSTWAGLDVTAYVGVDEVELVGPGGEIVTHPLQRFGGRSVDYRHYIRELAHKPQALRQVADELLAALGEPFAAAWRLLVDEHGPKQAARVFAQVLRAVEDRGELEVAREVRAALASGEPMQLAVRSRTTSKPMPPQLVPSSLADIEVHAAAAADYDTLLGGAQ